MIEMGMVVVLLDDHARSTVTLTLTLTRTRTLTRKAACAHTTMRSDAWASHFSHAGMVGTVGVVAGWAGVRGRRRAQVRGGEVQGW